MFKIWGRITSINVRKAVYAAQELGLDFERIDAGGVFGVVCGGLVQRCLVLGLGFAAA